MAYDIKGTIKRIGPIEVKSEKFSKRSIILDVEDGKYPQIVEMQATGDRCALFDQFSEGDQVSIAWNLRGREWTGRDGVTKVFNSCDVWKVELVSKGAGATRGGSHDPAPSGTNNSTDDLPF